MWDDHGKGSSKVPAAKKDPIFVERRAQSQQPQSYPKHPPATATPSGGSPVRIPKPRNFQSIVRKEQERRNHQHVPQQHPSRSRSKTSNATKTLTVDNYSYSSRSGEEGDGDGLPPRGGGSKTGRRSSHNNNNSHTRPQEHCNSYASTESTLSVRSTPSRREGGGGSATMLHPRPTRTMTTSSHSRSTNTSSASGAMVYSTDEEWAGGGSSGRESLRLSHSRSSATTTAASSSSRHPPLPTDGRRRESGSRSPILHRSDRHDEEEQAMFEQRLCEDPTGVAVRKIDRNGKSQLRCVRCVPLTVPLSSSSSMLIPGGSNSLSNTIPRPSHHHHERNPLRRLLGGGSGGAAVGNAAVASVPSAKTALSAYDDRRRAMGLSWGKPIPGRALPQLHVVVPLEKFVAVTKGKSTERTRKSTAPASHLLSLKTEQDDGTGAAHICLDVEAPTRLDRDKFARAFAKFLGVPLEVEEADDGGDSTGHRQRRRRKGRRRNATEEQGDQLQQQHNVEYNEDDDDNAEHTDAAVIVNAKKKKNKKKKKVLGKFIFRVGKKKKLKESKDEGEYDKDEKTTDKNLQGDVGVGPPSENPNDKDGLKVVDGEPSVEREKYLNTDDDEDEEDFDKDDDHQYHAYICTHRRGGGEGDSEEDDDISSLTGGDDDGGREAVEELHRAVEELKAELEASRAEAARAVSVAEQAIQSAEASGSHGVAPKDASDWNSTVTHKAAEAAARAQVRSAEAIARQRAAEDRLAAERKSAAFWRKQSELASDRAGRLESEALGAAVRAEAISIEHACERRGRRSNVVLEELAKAGEVRKAAEIERLTETNRDLDLAFKALQRRFQMQCEETAELERRLTLSSESNNINSDTVTRVTKEKWKKFHRIGKRRYPARKDRDRDSSSVGSLEATSSSLALLAPSFYNEKDDDLSAASMKRRPSGGGSSIPSPRRGRSDVHVIDVDIVTEEKVARLGGFAADLRDRFEVLRRDVAEEIRVGLPGQAREWTDATSCLLGNLQVECKHLRRELAMERHERRWNGHRLADLRGMVRVYCRPRPPRPTAFSKAVDILRPASTSTYTSTHTYHYHHPRRVCLDGVDHEYDRSFPSSGVPNHEVYAEAQDLVTGILEGFVVGVVAFGPTGSGKWHTLFGSREATGTGNSDYHHHPPPPPPRPTAQRTSQEEMPKATVTTPKPTEQEEHTDQPLPVSSEHENHDGPGMFFRTLHHLLRLRRRDYRDAFSVSFLEVTSDGALVDRLAAPLAANTTSPPPLEIRTHYDGDTVVEGLTTVRLRTPEDLEKILSRLNVDEPQRHQQQDDSENNNTDKTNEGRRCRRHRHTFVATIHAVCTNVATGVGTVGRLQFVKLPGADVLPVPPSSSSTSNLSASSSSPLWRFTDRSILALEEVVKARTEFRRSVPYRKSNVTRLLKDVLEGDAKVLVVLCVGIEEQDRPATAATLRFGSLIRRVEIGKATRHTLGMA